MIASRQEILIAYLCVITTVVLVLLWSWSRDCIDAARARSVQPRASPRPPQRAALGMREPAFTRSAPALTRTGSGEFGRSSSDAQMRARREMIADMRDAMLIRKRTVCAVIRFNK
jgi:hypothetical protein